MCKYVFVNGIALLLEPARGESTGPGASFQLWADRFLGNASRIHFLHYFCAIFASSNELCCANWPRAEIVPKVDRFLTEMVGVSGEPLLIKGFVGVGKVFGKVFDRKGRWFFENQFRDAVGLAAERQRSV